MLLNIGIAVFFFGITVAAIYNLFWTKKQIEAATTDFIEEREDAIDAALTPLHVVYKGWEIPLRAYQAELWGKLPDKEKDGILDALLKSIKSGQAHTEEGEAPDTRRIIISPSNEPRAVEA